MNCPLYWGSHGCSLGFDHPGDWHYCLNPDCCAIQFPHHVLADLIRQAIGSDGIAYYHTGEIPFSVFEDGRWLFNETYGLSPFVFLWDDEISAFEEDLESSR